MLKILIVRDCNNVIFYIFTWNIGGHTIIQFPKKIIVDAFTDSCDIDIAFICSAPPSAASEKNQLLNFVTLGQLCDLFSRMANASNAMIDHASVHWLLQESFCQNRKYHFSARMSMGMHSHCVCLAFRLPLRYIVAGQV